jgi:hypothetical protein
VGCFVADGDPEREPWEREFLRRTFRMPLKERQRVRGRVLVAVPAGEEGRGWKDDGWEAGVRRVVRREFGLGV